MAKPWLVAALAFLVACSGGPDGLGPTALPTAVLLNRDTATVGIDGNVKLIARDASGRTIAAQVLQWTSANAGVARVDAAGLVTGVAAGESEIRARVGELGDTARITVLPLISLGAVEPRAINTTSAVGGESRGQAFVWTRAGGIRLLAGLPGRTGDAVLGLSDQHTAVGVSGGRDFTTGQPVAWTLHEDGTATVERLPWDGGPTGIAHGVSEAGDRIVGEVFAEPEPTHYSPRAALWTRDPQGDWRIELLPIPPDGYGAAFRVNDSGLIVGLIEAPGPQGFTTSIAVWQQSPDLTWTVSTIATGALGSVSAGGMNAAGDVVGSQDDRAVLWTRSAGGWTAQDLGTLGGTDFSFAADITDARTIVGASFDSQERQRAFIWTSAEGMRDLGSLSLNASARVMNATGVVAGVSYQPESVDLIGTVWPAP
jgi:probable HAF family extracellular repeat protein